LRIALLIAYTIVDLRTVDDYRQQIVLCFLNIASWIRGLSYLRIFKSTRILIRLLVQVCIDIIPFIVVLVGALLGFSISLAALELEDMDTTLKALGVDYRLMYGDFTVDNNNSPGWILFILASALMALVMLNMLIAIMSDTYARVMGEIVPYDYFEMNNIILE